jgi:hypothetical protein
MDSPLRRQEPSFQVSTGPKIPGRSSSTVMPFEASVP